MFKSDVFAKRVKQAREEKGLSQKVLAQKIGITPSTMSNYEKVDREDNKIPTVDKVMAIAEELNVSVDWLLGLGEKETSTKGDNIDGEMVLRVLIKLIGNHLFTYDYDNGFMILKSVNLDMNYTGDRYVGDLKVEKETGIANFSQLGVALSKASKAVDLTSDDNLSEFYSTIIEAIINNYKNYKSTVEDDDYPF